MSYEKLLREMFDAAIAAAQPSLVLPRFLPPKPKGRTVVVGAGKAAASMAKALEDSWPHPLSGCVVTRDGHEIGCDRIEVISASHPTPDQRSVSAARRLIREVEGLTAEDLVIALVSGGGSSLLALPAPGLTLADKQTVNSALLNCGASISEINCVRRHLSGIKNGRLAAAAAPAQVLTLLISDVPGDDPSVIASGPTIRDTSTPEDAVAIIDSYGINASASVRAVLSKQINQEDHFGPPQILRHEIIARPLASLEAAATIAARAGLRPVILGDDIEGEARVVARMMADRVRQVLRENSTRAVALISGGETTVTIHGDGRGGRNVEFLLALALELDEIDGVSALAGDTDGVDGIEEVAGAVINSGTLAKARKIGLDPTSFLENNDAHSFFQKTGCQIVTGPTMTNVNDFRAIIIDPTLELRAALNV